MSRRLHVSAFGRSGRPVLVALVRGIEACGDAVTMVRPQLWQPADAVPTDAAIVQGCGPVTQPLIDFYRTRCPVLVLDLPGVRNEPGLDEPRLALIGPQPETAIWSGWVNGVADVEDTSEDRWRRLLPAVEIEPSPDGVALVCGQKPEDRAHCMTAGELEDWLREAAHRTRQMAPDARIVYRPHPEALGIRAGWQDEQSPSRDVPLVEDLRRARLVVTYNSTVGPTAIRCGRPVLCDESAFYAEWAESADRDGMLRALSPHQWGRAELESGEAWRSWRSWISEQTGPKQEVAHG